MYVIVIGENEGRVAGTQIIDKKNPRLCLLRTDQ